MKIELDFSNAKTLRQEEKELLTALAAVRHAITVAESASPTPETRFPPIQVSTADAIVWRVIEALPNEFTTTDVIAAVGDTLSRGSTLSALMRAHGRSKVEVIERGVGRRPSKYRKLETKN